MIKEGFTLPQYVLRGFKKEHQMIECIVLCPCLAFFNLACWLSFFEDDPCEDQDLNDIDRGT